MENWHHTLSFARVSGKKVEADFEGGCTTHDGGLLLLRMAEAHTGVLKRMVAALPDRRHPSYIDHSSADLFRQRVFQIACGYEDANDSDDLRCDPGLKAACERAPLTGPDLASQPTLSRLENRVSRSDLYRLARSLLDTFIASYPKPPKKIILDIDDTEDITHGAQQLTLFNAYHKEYCYMPVHLYEGHSGRLITAILRRGRRIKGREAAAILRRVFAAIREAWPKVQITLRGDSHFSTPEVHEVCEEYGLSFILGQAPNSKLHRTRGAADGAGAGAGGKARQRGAGTALYQFRLPGQELEAPAAHPLQSRSYPGQSQSSLCDHQHPGSNPQVFV